MSVRASFRIRRRLRRESATETASRLPALGRICARIPAVRAWAEAHTDSPAAALALLGRCVAMGAVGAALLASSTSGLRALAAVPLGAFIGARLGLALHDRRQRAAALETRRALPYALDRLATCVLAGMSVERALRLIAPGTPGPFGAAITDGLRAIDMGVPRARAYERIAARAQAEEVRGLMAGLARAERFGTSVSTTLVAQARELRSRARAAAEAEARTAPVKLIFPLVFCFLPAFVLLTIAPIALSALRTLGRV